jgi:uncharacterized protein
MNKHAFLVATMMLLSLVCGRGSDAQSKSQQSSGRLNASQATFIAEPIELETPTATLFGTLVRPQSSSPAPVVIIVAGSGPTDRNGNSVMLSGPNNSLKLLAEGLAAQGIASVRYDKRGVSETGRVMRLAAEKNNAKLREEDLRFESYIDDAVLWGKKLRIDRRFSTVTVIGHSEGSLIGMVAAQRMGANAYVSIAGEGRPMQVILLEQVKGSLPPDLLKTTEDILDQLAAGKTVATVPSALNVWFRPSIQQYMISWFHYDPAKEIAAMSMPVLIVQGTTDIQVSLQDAKLLSGTNPKAELVMIDGMNHVLKTVSSDRDKQVASYSDPSLPVDPRLISSIAAFVKKVK